MIRSIYALILLFPALILSSCFEGEEEIWVHANGSGRVVANFKIPSIAMGQIGEPQDFVRALKLIDDQEPGIEITDLSFAVAGGRAILHLEADFDNALELLSLVERNEEILIREASADPAQIEALAGNIDFKLDGLTPTLKREVAIGTLFPKPVQKRPKMLGSSTFKYTIHLPTQAKETNAHSVTNEGRTVSWSFLLSDHISDPMKMSLTTGLPVPWWGWALAGILGLGLFWLLWRFVIRRFVISPKSR